MSRTGPPAYSAIRAKLSEAIESFQNYRRGHIPQDVVDIISDVAMNSMVSQLVLGKLRSGLQSNYKRELRCVRTIFIAVIVLPLVLAPLVGTFWPIGYFLIDGTGLLGREVPNMLFIWMIAFEICLVKDYYWRRENSLAYIAEYLVKSLQAGRPYYDDPTNTVQRDAFATSVQQVGMRYFTAFKHSNSTRLFKSHVTAKARGCRNDILSMIPALVTARKEEVKNIQCNLARLAIRSQTGYWYQTEDIAKPEHTLPKRDAIRLSVATFIQDRTIQVAVIAGVSAIVGVIVSSIIRR